MLEDDATLPSEHSELEIIKNLAGIAYIAGADTTSTAINSYFLAMLLYPDVQAKAQAELDRVVGKDRLPELNDAPQMPYVQGVVNECLRWISANPMCKSRRPCPFGDALIDQNAQPCRMPQPRTTSIRDILFQKVPWS
jgi:cytochrome P450